MDYVKREEQNLSFEDAYKVYTEALQKSQLIDTQEYQHTAISMEQLQQAMHNTLAAGNFAHNLSIPLSPRQMSTLMLKTNHFNRSLHFNDIPVLLPRNSDNELGQSIVNENVTQNLVRNIHPDELLPRNINGEFDMQNLPLTLSEQVEISRNIAHEMGHNLTRGVNDLHLQQILVRNDNLVQNPAVVHALIRNQNLSQEVMDESRRTPVVVHCVPDQMMDSHIGQRLPNPNPNIHHEASGSNEQQLPPFNIKSEQEDDGYFYDTMNSGFVTNMNVPDAINIPQSMQQENHMYTTYTHEQTLNQQPIAPMDLYNRPQNYIQNYNVNNVRENPQNLVIHRQYDNHSPYQQGNLKLQQNNTETNNAKIDTVETNENLKPVENKIFEPPRQPETSANKMHYPDYYEGVIFNGEKNDNDTENKPSSDQMSINIKGEYTCYKCNDIFPSKRGLKQHTKSCQQNDDSNHEIQEKVGKYCCSQCPYRCQSPAILKIHERTHTGEKPFSCTFCDYKSGQKNNVAKHVLVHMKEKPYRCQYCDYRCAQKNNLVVHERTHTGYKPFACSYCDYRTVQKPNLVKHMYLHTDQKPFSCDMCNYRCVQKTNLMKHKQRHLNEKDGDKVDFQNKPYRPRQKSVKCPHCPYRCVQKSSLDKHITFKHGDICPQVNEEYNQEGYEDNGLNLMKSEVLEVRDVTIQNLSEKKVRYEVVIEQNLPQERQSEPSHLES